MKNFIKILVVIALFALVALQYFILSNIHTHLKENLISVDDNPYQTLFSKMWLLVLASVLIILFVIFCFIAIWRMLSKLGRESRMKKEHTYAMIHDMKTPLSAINLVAEDLEEKLLSNSPTSFSSLDTSVSSDVSDTSDNSDIYHDIRILKEESSHLNKICELVIKVAKLESNKLKFVFEDILLREFLEGVCAKFPPSIKVNGKEKKVDISIDIPKDEIVNADRLYFGEIVDNIIDNSIKYSGDSVEIKISSGKFARKSLVNMPGIERLHIWRNKRFIEIMIEDNGIGISESIKSKLFKKFERGENTIEISGHGIGLHYVYQLMKMIGGYVKVDGKVGSGTIVILGFPED